MAPKVLNDIFQNRALPYSLRVNPNFSSRQVHSVYHGTESLSFLGPINNKKSTQIFKNKIKKWVPSRCPSKLCCIYLQNLGFF